MRGFVGLIAATFLSLSLAGCMDSSPESMSLQTAFAVQNQTKIDDCPPGELHEFDMYVSHDATWTVFEETTASGFAFSLSPDGPFTVPGPTLRVTQCDTLRVHLHAPEGPFSHTIHWHGLSLPWKMDGVPYVTQDVGRGVFTYEFQVKESGTYWYHCHIEAPVHQEAGMYGALIVDPLHDVDPPFDREEIVMLGDLDRDYFDYYQVVFGNGEYDPELDQSPWDSADDAMRAGRSAADLALLIAEGATGVDGPAEGPRPYYQESSIRYRPEYDTFMLNGKSYPDTAPIMTETGDTVRIRLIHAGSLMHVMHLHGHHFLVTHKDGYPLSNPYWADTLVIGAGERYDLYVYSDNPGIWDFHDHAGGWGYGGHTANDFAFPGGMSTMLVYEDLVDTDVEGFTPEATTSGSFALFDNTARGGHH